ncbi:MAG: histidine kinase [Flavobacteriales bacterium]|nr:histidine kinase [Flavobacteriales bacterium]
MKKLLPVLLVWMSGLSALAQQPYFYLPSTENIPSKEVYRVFQDDQGYVWLGCNAGLFRYDGANFMQYQNTELSGRAISNLELDPMGRLWCGTFTGQIFFVENNSLKLFEDWSENEKQFPVFKTTEDGLWLTSDSGLHHVSFEHNQLIYGFAEDERPHTENIHVTAEGEIIVFSIFNGFYRIAANQPESDYLEVPSEFASYLEGQTHFVEWKGKLLVLWQRNSDGKAVWMEIQQEMIVPFDGFDNDKIRSRVNRVSTDKQGNIWVSTNAGAILFDGLKTRTFLPEQRVADVMEDREGNYWFATLENGIQVAPSIEILQYGKEFFGDSFSNITAIAKGENGDILLGHANGSVSSFELENERFQTILEAKSGTHRTTEKLFMDEGKLRVARGSFSIASNGQLIEIPKGGNAKDFTRGKGDTLLIATVTGLSKLFHNEKGKWERELLRDGHCRKVVVTQNGEIWAAFKDGTFYGNAEKMEPFLKDGKPVFTADIQLDETENIWIATISNGLLKVSRNEIVSEWNTANGLGSNDLHCIYVDGNSIWIAHSKGLDCLANEKLQHFDALDGMPLKEISDILVLENHIFLTSHDGLTVIPLELKPVNAAAPKLISNTILLGDRVVSDVQDASFPYTFNELKIDLSVLAFRSRGTCKVKYRLAGLDTTWSEQTGNRIEILYNALPAGNFQFEAYAENEDGIRSEETISFSFSIKPPFWQTWWFYLLVAVLSIGLVSGLFLLRIRYINRKAALEHAVVSSKLTALRSQMNPHFLFNALNSIQELVLSKDTKNAIKYLGTFSGLTRTILENSAKETVRLSQELEMLNQYLELEKLRFGDTLAIQVRVDASIDQEGTRIPPMLIQPYVENALKHGLLHVEGLRKLSLGFEQNNQVLNVTIEDNGVGRAKAEEIAKQNRKHESFSSDATENRLQSMKNALGVSGSVEIIDLYQNEKAVGTKVVVRIPIKA